VKVGEVEGAHHFAVEAFACGFAQQLCWCIKARQKQQKSFVSCRIKFWLKKDVIQNCLSK
jgi:hypothetical protein